MESDHTRLGPLVESLLAELSVAMRRDEVVRTRSDAVAKRFGRVLTPPDVEALRSLAVPLRSLPGKDGAPVADLLEAAADRAGDPWAVLEPLAGARDPSLVVRGLRAARALAAKGKPIEGRRVLSTAARLLDAGSAGIASDEALDALTDLLRGKEGDDPLLRILLDDDDPAVRAVAAKLLDRGADPAIAATARAVLGAEAWAFLEPLLEYTRATHADLVHLSPRRGAPPPALESLRAATMLCGEKLVREVVADMGWERVSLGLEVRKVTAVRVGNSVPYFVSPEEAALLLSAEGSRRVGDYVLVLGHGGPAAAAAAADGEDPVVRYRGYNLAHAEALREILDVAPLDRRRLERLVALLDRIVADHAALFRPHADECAILPDVWAELKRKIAAEVERQGATDLLSPELTRLVMAFEDPASLGAVRTLHGLKRYLHQTGLKLGFRLVSAGRATNRTVDVRIASGGKIVRKLEGIRYVDFEPAARETAGAEPVPYAVRIVAEGFARQLLHGRTSFPTARVFCYGNEVHYYLTYGTHPALVRIDFAPPLQGGMVDLEYYGVSRYELDAHPGRDLDAVRAFFRGLGYHVEIAPNTRVHARYDKERAIDLGDLLEKAEALFRLAPYLMDLDWVLGDLELRPDARRLAARAWARRFVEWGGLPLDGMLTRGRLGILAGIEEGPAGETELVWNGDPPYRDRFENPPPGALAPFLEKLAAKGVEDAVCDPADPALAGQTGLEARVLAPLREALARGELVAGPAGLERAPADRFRSEHETEAFAALLDGDEETLAASVRMARTILGLERTLSLRTTGSLNGHEVQRARIALRGGSIGLHVLRGPKGMVRLAIFSPRAVLGRRREHAEEPWREEGSTDGAALATILRANGYEPSPCDLGLPESLDEARRIREAMRRPNPHERPRLFPGERVAEGVPASPGRAVGRAILGGLGRSPEEFEGRVLVAATLRPEDGPILARACGVVSTGGGVLSHAGLIAAQYRKPALIVSGIWSMDGSGPGSVRVRVGEYREEEAGIEGFAATVRREAVEREHPVREGDLVVIDADRGTLEILGQHADALSLHDGLRSLGGSARRLEETDDPVELLALRGERLRARHRAAAVLERLSDPVLARFAVREILRGGDLAGTPGGTGERGGLLSILLANPAVAAPAREHLAHVHGELSRLHAEAIEEASRRIPEAATVHEVLTLRREATRLSEVWREANEAVVRCGLAVARGQEDRSAVLDTTAARRLDAMRTDLLRELPALAAAGDPRLRHRLRALARLDALLGEPSTDPTVAAARRALEDRDLDALAAARGRKVLRREEAGFECAPLVGWKAANLAEVARLAGPERVPPWFAVTDVAFREALRSRVGPKAASGERPVLEDAIAEVISRADFDLATRARAIADLWDRAELPDGVRDEIEGAYASLRGEGDDDPFVAVRSSALGEDTEAVARAGEFDTFLFVRGAASVTEHVKRAWAGLWNARAQDSRAREGAEASEAGGGVIVQRMVDSRVSGVVQTVHAAESDAGEIVINAGLGLGEGVVSGAVGADQITVSKEGDLEKGPLRFRYVVGDKAEMVVRDEARGGGTRRVETRYHQRRRAALEYVELLEIVGTAARLEAAYGYPLDIEFALEEDRLSVLQARPVPGQAALFREEKRR
jgi:pyruvate,water dikinase